MSSGKTAWELWIILPLLGLSILGNIYNLIEGQGNPAGFILACMMFFGLLARTRWGWWLTTILSALCVPLLLFVATQSAFREISPVLQLLAVFYVGIVGLLISVRSRGAY